MLKFRDRPALVALLVFAVFSPSIFGELSIVDDLDMYHWLSNAAISLNQLFFPHVGNGAYYRPLIGVSYMLDKYVWLLDTRLMHLDNIFFHIINALLVYRLAQALLPDQERSKSRIPFAASLVFGLHPLVTESVEWISGRTDVMACTFVLLSALCLLSYRRTHRPSALIGSFLILIPGVLVKETAIAFVIAAAFILSAAKGAAPVRETGRAKERCAFFAVAAAFSMLVTYSVWTVFVIGFLYMAFELLLERVRAGGESRKVRLAPLVFAFSAAGISATAFFVIRKVVFTSSISSVGRTLQLIAADLNYACQTFLGTAGFYVKKFFLPFPLNFAIREIDPAYNFAGVAVFFVCLYLIRRGTLLSAFFLAGVCMFLPSLPLSLGTVTWTAYAERYIYISCAFWAITVTIAAASLMRERGVRSLAVPATVLLILCMGTVSYRRSITWKTNVALLGDTVKKSPTFKQIRLDYMAALINGGDKESAKAQYRAAQAIPSVGYMEGFDLNMASIYVSEGKHADAERLYQKALAKTKNKSATACESYSDFLCRRYAAFAEKGDAVAAQKTGIELLGCYSKLYGCQPDPQILYRMGQLALRLGERESAFLYFSHASRAFPAGSDYGIFAGRLAKRLGETYQRQEAT